ncbi:hydroxyacylglutathione hydrolase [Vibrio cholerae]|uniref:hydroxyacylglutathione hydrolase n=1 Tax=Vibrio cholerae TaxID=666 RepID=UPI000E0B30E4|nr:hydroxyacylglutathione hydrolase [Vibrio cholerae]EGR0581033.1 hydroxyacylglutathione hydrolase [Vibrio cholerae]MDP4494328.1 hydroxyacylglutathione hydrolase [Vibrio cholerae]RNE72310.1 hydroxyacylglutathione hydrolase [Vibrio cholerae]WLP80205.1 hydroxyacylglutathione hydrolase [Vibrio cholerae]
MLKVSFVKAFLDNYIWILSNDEKAIVIDPGDARKVCDFLTDNNLSLEAILITHHHFDHINGVPELLDKFHDAKLIAPMSINSDLRSFFVTEGSQIILLDSIFEVIELPGHTDDHIGFRYKNMLFCGDVLFSSGCGKVSNGQYEKMLSSLSKISSLPNNTIIYCGHEYTRDNLIFANYIEPGNEFIQEYIMLIDQNEDMPTIPTSLLLEKKINPFLRLLDKENLQFFKYDGYDDNLIGFFKKIRKLKDDFNNNSVCY